MHLYNRRQVTAQPAVNISTLLGGQNASGVRSNLDALFMQIRGGNFHLMPPEGGQPNTPQDQMIMQMFVYAVNSSAGPLLSRQGGDWHPGIRRMALQILKEWAKEVASSKDLGKPVYKRFLDLVLGTITNTATEMQKTVRDGGSQSPRHMASGLLGLFDVAKDLAPVVASSALGSNPGSARTQTVFNRAITGAVDAVRPILGKEPIMDELEASSASLLPQKISTLDTLIIEVPEKPNIYETQKANIARYKENEKHIQVGAKVKIQHRRWTNPVPGTIEGVERKQKQLGTRIAYIPVLQIVPEGAEKGQIIEVSVVEPNHKVWISQDVAKIPIEEYKGIFVKTTDPKAIDLAWPEKATRPVSINAVLVRKKGDTVILKISRGKTVYTVEVPTSSVTPTEIGPSWAEPYAREGAPFDVNDVVEIEGQEGPYLVKGKEAGKITVVSILRPKERIEVPASTATYVGRYDLDKGVVPQPHFKSPALSPKPVPQAVRPPAPPLAPEQGPEL